MPKDGRCTGPERFVPEKWGVLEGEDNHAVKCGPSVGPTIGGSYDLHLNWNGRTSTTFESCGGGEPLPLMSVGMHNAWPICM